MGSNQFVFPPPPPAPPQSIYNYQALNQIPAPYNSHVDRGSRGYRGFRTQGRGNNPGRSRGAYRSHDAISNIGSHGSDQFYHTSPSSYPGGASGWRGSLPSLPPIQQPQYPADVHDTYNRPSQSHAASAPRGLLNPTQHPHHMPHLDRYQRGDFTPDQGLNNISSHGPHSANRPGQPSAYLPMAGSPASASHDQWLEGAQSRFNDPDLSNGTKYQALQSNGTHQMHTPDRFGSQSRGRASFFPDRGRRGQKRGHGEAIGRRGNHPPNTEVAPAVPSFGAQLSASILPPRSQEQTKRPKKRRRKYNQLGLTPKTEDHESSEEEEDAVDEEAKLAAAVAGPISQPQCLQITYNGLTLNLQSPSDIAKWVEERKKRFPTKARAAEAAERKIKREEAQNAANQARKDIRGKQKTAARERRRRRAGEQHSEQTAKQGPEDAAFKAKRKVEILRRQLDKEEKRVAKAEARAKRSDKMKAQDEDIQAKFEHSTRETKKRKRSQSIERTLATPEAQQTSEPNSIELNMAETLIRQDEQSSLAQKQQDVSAERLASTLQPCAPEDGTPSPILQSNDVIQEPQVLEIPEKPTVVDEIQRPHGSDASLSDLSSDLSLTVSEDLTSSSGSSSIDDSSVEAAPETLPTKRNGPERIPAPRRKPSKQICNAFLRSGRCKFGSRCRNLHELPQKGTRSAKAKTQKFEQGEGRKARIGLYQRLVEQEQENESRELLAASSRLKEEGLTA